MKTLIFAAAIGIGSLLLPVRAALPDPSPPFQVFEGKRQDPVLKTGSFFKDGKEYAQPGFWIGNKRIGVRETARGFEKDRDQFIGLFVDNREMLRFSFWGSYPGLGFAGASRCPPGRKRQKISNASSSARRRDTPT